MKILVTAFGPFAGRSENASHLALKELKRLLPTIRTRVFPVDSVIAPARLRRAIREISPDLVILLGEAAGSTTIRLETTAWNLLDFPIPDIAGRQPKNQPISRTGPAEIKTTFPLATFPASHPVILSDDPGRYLCNQIYYIARTFTDHALFIHLPLPEILPPEEAAATLTAIISALAFAPDSF